MMPSVIKKTKCLGFEVSTIKAGREYETLIFNDSTGDTLEDEPRYSTTIEGGLKDHLDCLSQLVEVYGE